MANIDTGRPAGKTALDTFIGLLWVIGVYVAVSVALVWLSVAMGTAATN